MAQFAPPPELTVSQWADAERRLPPESSAEPGQWRTDRAEYQREILDCTAPTVVLMASSQVGKTEILLNLLGYHMALDPGPALLIAPTLELAGALSKDRIQLMIRDTPVLREKIGTYRTRDAKQTTLHLVYPGGTLTLAGANSPASLASRPIRFLLADEIDRYELSVGRKGQEEGDPLSLAVKRTTTFWNRKIFIVSTPTVAGVSRIEKRYAQSDQRHYFVPCPRCAVPFVIAWRDLRWENDDPSTAHLECPTCDGRIEDRERGAMVRAGAWRATAPYRGVAGFHIWEAYSPWVSLVEIATAYYRAKELGREGLVTFKNTVRGETWEDEAERVEPHVLIARREPYSPTLPAGVCCLVAGVDTQDDRLEVQVLGIGPGLEIWAVDVRTLDGDPSRPEPWAALDDLLDEPWPHAFGVDLMIVAAAIDSAGHRTSFVYDYALRNQHRNVYAIIGRAGHRPTWARPKTKRHERDPRVVTLGVDELKSELYTNLRNPQAGPGYVHFPSDRLGFDPEYFAQLTAEKLVTQKNTDGELVRVWKQTRARNEALDTAVMAMALVRGLNLKLERMAERVRKAAVQVVQVAQAPEPEVETVGDPADPPAPVAPVVPPPGRRVFRSGFMDRGRGSWR